MSVLACIEWVGGHVTLDNVLYAQEQAMIVAALAVLSLALWLIQPRFLALPICVLVLLAIHPAWTVSIGGDCGAFKANLSTGITAISALCVVLLTLSWLWPNRKKKAPNHRPQLTGDGRDGK